MTKNDIYFKVLKFMVTKHPDVLAEMVQEIGVEVLQNNTDFVMDQVKEFVNKIDLVPDIIDGGDQKSTP